MENDALLSANIDEWGRVLADYDLVIELLLSGKGVGFTKVVYDDRMAAYNDVCSTFDKPEKRILDTYDMESPREFHERQSKRWLIEAPENGLWDRLLMKCKSPEEIERFAFELEEFDRRDMIPVLLQLNQMIETLDAHGVVRGVGRGSSVASFLLYLMDVHFINPMTYGLDFSEFMKDAGVKSEDK